MGLDIRLPIGGLFTTVGLLLVVFGARSNPALYQRSLGININLDWGMVMLVFGVAMGVMGLRRMKSKRSHEDQAPSEERVGADHN